MTLTSASVIMSPPHSLTKTPVVTVGPLKESKITSASQDLELKVTCTKSLWLCQVTCSQVLEIRMGSSLGANILPTTVTPSNSAACLSEIWN